MPEVFLVKHMTQVNFWLYIWSVYDTGRLSLPDTHVTQVFKHSLQHYDTGGFTTFYQPYSTGGFTTFYQSNNTGGFTTFWQPHNIGGFTTLCQPYNTGGFTSHCCWWRRRSQECRQPSAGVWLLALRSQRSMFRSSLFDQLSLRNADNDQRDQFKVQDNIQMIDSLTERMSEW